MSALVSASTFDRLRLVGGRGHEYWSARDLCDALGYERWENFATALDRARVAAGNTGAEPRDHFRGASKMVETGSGAVRRIDDCHLTRFAAYLVAMNGDPRKPEIAAAQTYFAIKTREAETVPTAPQFEIPTNLADALQLAASLERDRQHLAEQVEEQAPKVALATALLDAAGDYSVRDAAHILERDHGIEIGAKRLFDFLKTIGWIDKGKRPRPYQAHLQAGRLAVRSSTFIDDDGEPHVTTQVRITPKGLAELHRRLGGDGPTLALVPGGPS